MLSHRLVLAGMAGHNPSLECEAYINDEPAVQAVDFVEVGSGPSALHPPVTAFRAFDPAPPHGDPRWTCLLRISGERLLEAGVSPRPPDRAVALPPPELTQEWSSFSGNDRQRHQGAAIAPIDLNLGF